jgi:hypothetical protein
MTPYDQETMVLYIILPLICGVIGGIIAIWLGHQIEKFLSKRNNEVTGKD